MRASASIRPTICATATTRTGWPARRTAGRARPGLGRGAGKRQSLRSGGRSRARPRASGREGRAEEWPRAVRSRSRSIRRRVLPSAIACGRSIGWPATRERTLRTGPPGVVHAHYSAHVFDLSALGQREGHLYSVRFEAGELWGKRPGWRGRLRRSVGGLSGARRMTGPAARPRVCRVVCRASGAAVRGALASRPFRAARAGLSESGAVPWSEWSAALAREIQAARTIRCGSTTITSIGCARWSASAPRRAWSIRPRFARARRNGAAPRHAPRQSRWSVAAAPRSTAR